MPIHDAGHAKVATCLLEIIITNRQIQAFSPLSKQFFKNYFLPFYALFFIHSVESKK